MSLKFNLEKNVPIDQLSEVGYLIWHFFDSTSKFHHMINVIKKQREMKKYNRNKVEIVWRV